MKSFKEDLKNLNQSITMDLENDSDTVLITFAGISGALGLYPFEFFKITNGFNINKIFIRDLEQSWYHKGLKDYTKSIEGIATFLLKIINEKKYKNVICLGNSMGAYASIITGSLIKANKILAFSPQSFLDNKLREKYNDNRWKEQISNFPKNIKKEFLDLKLFFEKNEISNYTKIEIFFALDERIDAIHAMHLKDIDNIKLVPFYNGGHKLVQYLRRSGELYQILRNNLLSFEEDKILLIFKDLSKNIPLDVSLFKNNVDLEVFYSFYEKFKSFNEIQGALLNDFFNLINRYASSLSYFSIEQLNSYNLEKCKSWYTIFKNRPQMFGTFIYINNSDYLISFQIGTKNLHMGFVKYEKKNETFLIKKIEKIDYENIKMKLGLKELEFRGWGSKWCSIDLGDFTDLSNINKYRTIKVINKTIKTFFKLSKRLENE